MHLGGGRSPIVERFVRDSLFRRTIEGLFFAIPPTLSINFLNLLLKPLMAQPQNLRQYSCGACFY